jgi:signal recognition particle subunit SRP54
MFESLSASLSSALNAFRGRGRLTEANMREGLGSVRTALLEADVAYDVADRFLDRGVADAVGADDIDQAVAAAVAAQIGPLLNLCDGGGC